jgi:hypothetical protein
MKKTWKTEFNRFHSKTIDFLFIPKQLTLNVILGWLDVSFLIMAKTGVELTGVEESEMMCELNC